MQIKSLVLVAITLQAISDGLRVAILLTGRRSARLQRQFGTAADSFHRFLSAAMPIVSISSYESFAGHIPTIEEANSFDLLIIPGASKSVNWETEWMLQVESLITNPQRRAWVFGVCFGHQLVAKAYGGLIIRHPDGWEMGACTVNSAGGIAGPKRALCVLQSHQQHVVSIPGGLTVWAGNAHSHVQGLLSAEKRIFTTQFHPEYTKDYFEQTINRRPITRVQLEQVWHASLDHEIVANMLKTLIRR